MLRNAARPDHSTLQACLLQAEHADLQNVYPHRIRNSSVDLSVTTTPTGGLLRQRRSGLNCVAVSKLTKQQIGMSGSRGAHLKRTYIDELDGEEIDENIDLIRCSKRREVSAKADLGVFAPTYPQHQLLSGGSDLTTEQSETCMAADGYGSRKSTGSPSADGCLLRLECPADVATASAISRDTDEEDQSSKLPRFDASLCSDYQEHSARTARLNHFFTPLTDGRCTAGDLAQQFHRNRHFMQDKLTTHAFSPDWLELRLGHTDYSRDDTAGASSRSSSPRTLQFLPEKPESSPIEGGGINEAQLKVRIEKHHESKTAASNDHVYEQSWSSSDETLPSMGGGNLVSQRASTTETQQCFSTDVMMPSGLTKMQSLAIECARGQHVTSQGVLSNPHRGTSSTVDRPSNPRVCNIDRPPSAHLQQLLQDVNFQCGRDYDILNGRDSCQQALKVGEAMIKATTGSHFQELLPQNCYVQSRSALPDFLQRNWDFPPLSSLPTASPSPSILQAMGAQSTTYQDLIASSFVKESFCKTETCDSGGIPYLREATTALPYYYVGNSVSANHRSGSAWQAYGKTHLYTNHNRTFSDQNSDTVCADDIKLTANSLQEYGAGKCVSMGDWLSQALAATTFALDNGGTLARDERPNIDSNSQLLLPVSGNKCGQQSPLKLLSTGKRLSAASPGFWFALQSANTLESEASSQDASSDFTQQWSKPRYIRLKNGNVTLSVVKKFLIAKLGLPQVYQVSSNLRLVDSVYFV